MSNMAYRGVNAVDMAKYIDYTGAYRIVTAEEFERKGYPSISVYDRRLQCLQCGEYVAFVKREGGHSSYFRHGNIREGDRGCSLRVK